MNTLIETLMALLIVALTLYFAYVMMIDPLVDAEEDEDWTVDNMFYDSHSEVTVRDDSKLNHDDH